MPTNFPKKIRGFTLIEIIIALFVFSIVSIIVVGALHNVLSTQSATEKKAVRLAQLQVALLFISRDFEQVIDRPIMTASGSTPEGFIGTDTTVTFTHAGLENPMGQLQRSTLQRTRYQLNNEVLNRFTWPTLDQTQETKPDAKALLTTVSELHFEYLDNQGHFQKTWPPLGQTNVPLPIAVRVSLILKEWGKIIQLYIIPGVPIEKAS